MVEHKNMTSSTGKHYKDKHSTVPKDLDKQFSVLKKGNNRFYCLGHEMLLIIGNYHLLEASNRTQFEQNVLRNFAYFIYSNHQPEKLFISLSSLSAMMLNLKMASR